MCENLLNHFVKKYLIYMQVLLEQTLKYDFNHFLK